MSDLINRKDVLDILDQCARDILFDYGLHGLLYECMEEIEKLQSVEPAQIWIPCSERLPEEEVLCCDIQNNIMLGYVFVDIKSDSGFSAENENCFMYECVAWMPLPEPYKAESEDKE